MSKSADIQREEVREQFDTQAQIFSDAAGIDSAKFRSFTKHGDGPMADYEKKSKRVQERLARMALGIGTEHHSPASAGKPPVAVKPMEK